MSRRLPIALLVVAMLIPAVSAGASRAELSLRDTLYVSPAWGYAVRWYGDEWSVAEETSSGESDRLRLTDALGSVVTFEGRRDYQGDARTCLDDQLEQIAAEGGQDIMVLTDDLDRPQKIYHPWRSWMALLAGFEEAGEVTGTSFRWLGHISDDDGRTWRLEQEMLARRRPGCSGGGNSWTASSAVVWRSGTGEKNGMAANRRSMSRSHRTTNSSRTPVPARTRIF